MKREMKRWHVVAVTASAGLLSAGFGAWAFRAPRSFYDSVATFPTYNVHFMHDLEAFQFGIARALLATLVWRDALAVALFGVAVGVVVHFVSHVLDLGPGGRASDPLGLGLLALLLFVGLGLRVPAREDKQ
jgi:hypothetical protein